MRSSFSAMEIPPQPTRDSYTVGTTFWYWSGPRYMTSMKKKILFWKHMINRVFSRDFCSGMVLFTCRILIGNISRVTFTSSFQIVFPRPLWFHATECCVFRFKSVPTWWLCGPIGACAARLSSARIFVLLSSSLLMPRGEIYLRLSRI